MNEQYFYQLVNHQLNHLNSILYIYIFIIKFKKMIKIKKITIIINFNMISLFSYLLSFFKKPKKKPKITKIK